MADKRDSEGVPADQLAELQARRWASLGRLLGFASGLFNVKVIEGVRRGGHEDFRPTHAHLMRSLQPEGARIQTLADRASISKQAMSTIVAEMRALGYVQSAPDPADGRAVVVRYTEAGTDLLAQIISCAEAVEAEFNEVLGPERGQELRDSLESLFKALTPPDIADESGWTVDSADS